MKRRLKIIIPLALVIFAGAYKFVLAKPVPGPKPKIDGTVFVLPKDFLVNLRDGRFAKVDVALVLATAPKSGGEGAATPPDGYGGLPEEAVVRDIVTNALTDQTGDELISAKGREQLKQEIKHEILTRSDVKVDEVLFTDVAVQ